MQQLCIQNNLEMKKPDLNFNFLSSSSFLVAIFLIIFNEKVCNQKY
jgi:hypothetical protein